MNSDIVCSQPVFADVTEIEDTSITDPQNIVNTLSWASEYLQGDIKNRIISHGGSQMCR